MKVWVTRWATTTGICVGDSSEANRYSYAFVRLAKGGDTFNSREWHASREKAIEAAEADRKRKIVAIRKRLAKLEAMSFDDTPA